MHGGFENTGIVRHSEKLDYEDLSDAMKIYVRNQSQIYLLIVNHSSPDWTYAVIAERSFPTGTFVEMKENVNQWYVDYWDYSFQSSFDKIIISYSITEASHPHLIYERYLQTPSGQHILLISNLNQTFGPLFVWGLIYIATRRIMLWSIPLILLLYAAQAFASNVYALLSGVSPPSGLSFTALATFALIFLLYLVWRLERSERFRQAISKAF